MNKEKTQLAQEYDVLEKLAEEIELDDNEKNRFSFLENKLANIWRLKEIKIRQRSRERDILEGDRNTAYFQAVANHRVEKRKLSF